MNPVAGESRLRAAEARLDAITAERRAAHCCAELAARFEARGLGSVAALCRHLASRHHAALASLAGNRSPAGPGTWLEEPQRDFVLRVASPRQWIELARVQEQDALRCHGAMSGSDDADTQRLGRQLAAQASDNIRKLASAAESLPDVPDWDALIAAGAVPALVLGAERRLNR